MYGAAQPLDIVAALWGFEQQAALVAAGAGLGLLPRRLIERSPHGAALKIVNVSDFSAALDLCNVACGRFDGFWEFNLNPWDTAAGVLIVEEAGGRVTNFSGGPFQLDSRETLASNGLVHDALIAEFQAILAGRGLEELPSPVAYAKDHSS